MAALVYRIKTPVTVVVREINNYRLAQLPEGSLFETSGSRPDVNGMVDGTCKGEVVLIFSRDLEDRAELIASAAALY